jgi:hypothetical protein
MKLSGPYIIVLLLRDSLKTGSLMKIAVYEMDNLSRSRDAKTEMRNVQMDRVSGVKYLIKKNERFRVDFIQCCENAITRWVMARMRGIDRLIRDACYNAVVVENIRCEVLFFQTILNGIAQL